MAVTSFGTGAPGSCHPLAPHQITCDPLLKLWLFVPTESYSAFAGGGAVVRATSFDALQLFLASAKARPRHLLPQSKIFLVFLPNSSEYLLFSLGKWLVLVSLWPNVTRQVVTAHFETGRKVLIMPVTFLSSGESRSNKATSVRILREAIKNCMSAG